MPLTETQTRLILNYLNEETGLAAWQVANTVELLREGATVPFIARYRKERTGELDEVQVRLIEERFGYFSELEERKATVLASIEEQGKLSPELRTQIAACRQKTLLEDLYLPYKPKRRTKATIARERGLEPLADAIVAGTPPFAPLPELAAAYVNPEGGVEDAGAALAGAGHILAERVSEDAAVRALARRLTAEQGVFVSRVDPKQAGAVSKFEMYYDYREPLKEIPSHRMLAMRRGEKEELLRLTIEAPEAEILQGIRFRLLPAATPYAAFLDEVATDAYQRLIAPSIEVELRTEAKLKADETAIAVFADNLRNLLLQPPAGSLRTLGVDPGLRTGSKLAAVDATGKFLEHVTIYPHTGAGKVESARRELLRLVTAHRVEMIAIGNGTASREMEQFVRETLREAQVELPVVTVNEAGASVYSASEIAREEFPELDLTVRGAISIGRRLQDPLAELVKIDPKSIGVGQYQHDVSQTLLKKALDATVESCVNYVGVDLNTASWALLAYVSGIGESLARSIVRYRDAHGAFADRKALFTVPRFGAKAFEQAAGFLRIRNGQQPLDNTAVHPERYPLVKQMAADLGVGVAELAADPAQVEKIDLQHYVSETVGLPTLRDIVLELKKPGRDPRAPFQAVIFRDDVRELRDLQVGMLLDGTVTNVTAFGAFVDIGVHQDGLVHVSQLAHRFVKDPAEVVRVGQPVKVKVLEVDLPRKRIALSIKQASPDPGGPRPEKPRKQPETKPQGLSAQLENAGFRVTRKR